MGIFWFIVTFTLFLLVVTVYVRSDGTEDHREERIIMLDQEFQP